MKISLESLSITDFRGLSGTHIINLDSEIVFLSGPNGYGKTTVYDAIELCISGLITRIDEGRDSENKNKRHDSSVIHNNVDKDIKIQLTLIKDDETKIISVEYPAGPRQELINWERLTTKLLDSEGNIEGGRDAVSAWTEITAENYKLFGYLQQSDSTFFLKKAQKDRRSTLNPLLDINGKHLEDIESIDTFKTKISTFRGHLFNQLKSFNDESLEPTKAEVEYKRLVGGEVLHDYDQKEPFKNLTIEVAKEEYQKISENLHELELFFEEFNPKEYIKSRKQSFLNRIAQDNDFVRYVVLQNVLLNEKLFVTWEQKQRILEFSKNTDALKKYVLRTKLDAEEYANLQKHSENFNRINEALYNEDSKLKSISSILETIEDETNGFNQSEQEKAKNYLAMYQPLTKLVSSQGKIVSDLQHLRNELLDKYVSQHTHRSEDDNHTCPLCGFDWESNQKLISSIENETATIEKLLDGQAKKINELERQITKDFIDQLVKRKESIKKYAKTFAILQSVGILAENDLSIHSELDSMFTEMKISSLVEDNLSTENLDTAIKFLRNYIQQRISENEIKIFGIAKLLKTRDYKNYLSNVERLAINIPKDQLLSGDSLPSAEALNQAKENISQLFSKAASEITVTPELTLPEHEMIYKNTFLSKEEVFRVAKTGIKSKRLYIEQQYNKIYFQSQKIIQAKHDKIKDLIDKVDSLRTTYNDTLRNYQNNLTKKLQLPFYIYSAKILQNSPQCQGVFMYIDNGSGTILFTPERKASQDIVHQLSSGQLVVVSTAFYLALNVTFPQQSVGIMAIDDPIQDLDSLNVHSLTELIRREFVDKYQLIISTHNEQDVDYMKYKFGTALSNEMKISDINVQKAFFSASEQQLD